MKNKTFSLTRDKFFNRFCNSCAVLLILMPMSQSATAFEKVKKVNVNDIGNSVLIIGNLGSPLGKSIEVEVDIIEVPSGPKPVSDHYAIKVVRINNARLETHDSAPVFFSSSVIDVTANASDWNPKLGERWKLLVAETGGFVGHPPEIIQVAGNTHTARIPYEFQTRLFVAKCDRIDKR